MRVGRLAIIACIATETFVDAGERGLQVRWSTVSTQQYCTTASGIHHVHHHHHHAPWANSVDFCRAAWNADAV